MEDFVNNLIKHLTDTTRDSLQGSNAPLEEKLATALERAFRSQGITDELRELCKDVVYFGLDSTDIKSKKRGYVTAVNWQNLNQRSLTDDFISSAHFAEETKKSRAAATLVSFTTGAAEVPHGHEEKMRTLWDVLWYPYDRRRQKDFPDEAGLMTLNDWFIRSDIYAFNTGFYWGEQSLTADKAYFFLPEDALAEIHATTPAVYAGAEMPANWTTTPIRSDSLKKLEDEFRKMNIDKTKADRVPNLRFCLHHLVSSSAYLGGKCYYVFIINFGTPNLPTREIVSVCTTHPLSEMLVCKWYIFASKIFKDLISYEVESLSRTDLNISVHAIKTAVSVLLGTPLNNLSALLKDNYHVKKALAGARQILAYTEVINLLSKISFSQRDGKKSFECELSKSGLYAEGASRFTLPEIIAEITELRKRDQNLMKIKFRHEPGLALPPGFLRYKTLAPTKMFYEFFLYTIIENCKDHAKKNGATNEIDVCVYVESGSLYFVNAARTQEKEWRQKTEYVPLTEERMSGNFKLFYEILTALKIGRFEAGWQPKDGTVYFKTILKTN